MTAWFNQMIHDIAFTCCGARLRFMLSRNRIWFVEQQIVVVEKLNHMFFSRWFCCIFSFHVFFSSSMPTCFQIITIHLNLELRPNQRRYYESVKFHLELQRCLPLLITKMLIRLSPSKYHVESHLSTHLWLGHSSLSTIIRVQLFFFELIVDFWKFSLD